MTTATYDVGDTRRLTANYKVAGADTDPTALTFTLREPDGVETIYTWGPDTQLVNDSVGNFHVDWPITKAGRHVYRWAGTCTAAEAGGGEFYTRAKEMA